MTWTCERLLQLMYTFPFVSFVIPDWDFIRYSFDVCNGWKLGEIGQACQGRGQIMSIPKLFVALCTFHQKVAALAFEKWRFNKVGRYRNWAQTMPSLSKTHDNRLLTNIADSQRMFDECKICLITWIKEHNSWLQDSEQIETIISSEAKSCAKKMWNAPNMNLYAILRSSLRACRCFVVRNYHKWN